jgi:hypothetical protein
MDMTLELLVSLLASGISSLVVHAVKRLMPSTKTHGSIKNAMLPVCAVVVGIGFALIKAWFLHTEIRSEEGLDLIVWGVMIGLAGIGIRGAVKPFTRIGKVPNG